MAVLALSQSTSTPRQPADEFDRVWPWLKAAIAHGGDTHRKRHLRERIADGRAQLWTWPDAAAVTELITYDTGMRDCRWWLAGGNMKTLINGQAEIEAWARRQGCHRVTITGRKGWERVLPEYKPQFTVLTKEL